MMIATPPMPISAQIKKISALLRNKADKNLIITVKEAHQICDWLNDASDEVLINEKRLQKLLKRRCRND